MFAPHPQYDSISGSKPARMSLPHGLIRSCRRPAGRGRWLWLLALLALPGCVPAQKQQQPLPAAFTRTLLQEAPPRYLLEWRVRGNSNLRVLVELPADQPKAGLVLFAGDNGNLELQADGRIGNLTGNFLIRSSNIFLQQGMAVLMIDLPSDVSPQSSDNYRTSRNAADDTALVVDYIHKTLGIPAVLVGTSRGTISAANGAARLETGGANALVLTSSVLRNGKKGRGSIFEANLSAIRQPTLVVHNQQDGCDVCPYGSVPGLLKALSGASRKDLVTLSADGGAGAPCGASSAHGYFGIENQAVTGICSWIKQVVIKGETP